jgi:hypothetical protein
MLNDPFMLAMSRHFADSLGRGEGDLAGRVRLACRKAFGHEPPASELAEMEAYARDHGLANLCRVLLNLNAFVFVD